MCIQHTTQGYAMNNEQREQAFRDAIAKVCAEFNAEIQITDDGKPYGMHSPIMSVTMDTIRNSDDEIIVDFFSFVW